MLSIGTFIHHELHRSGWQPDSFHVEVDEISPAGEGIVRAEFALGGELCIRFWRAPDERVVLSVSMTPGSHSVRAVARRELADGLAGIVQRWLGELRATTV